MSSCNWIISVLVLQCFGPFLVGEPPSLHKLGCGQSRGVRVDRTIIMWLSDGGQVDRHLHSHSYPDVSKRFSVISWLDGDRWSAGNKYLLDLRIRFLSLLKENSIKYINLTGAHCFQGFIIIGYYEKFDTIKIRKLVLRMALIMSPVIGIFHQRGWFPGDKILQNKRTGADGMMPIA